MVDNVTAHQAPSASGTGRALNVTLWVLQVLLALAFAFSGVTKFIGSPEMTAFFEEMGTAGWMPYLVGGLEILGAIGLLIRRVAGLAAVGFVLLMIGAVVTHLIWGGSPVGAIVLLILSAVVAYGRQSSISALFTGASSR